MGTIFCFTIGCNNYKYSSFCGLHIKEYTTTTITFDHYNTSASTSVTGIGWVSYYGV